MVNIGRETLTYVEVEESLKKQAGEISSCLIRNQCRKKEVCPKKNGKSPDDCLGSLGNLQQTIKRHQERIVPGGG